MGTTKNSIAIFMPPSLGVFMCIYLWATSACSTDTQLRLGFVLLVCRILLPLLCNPSVYLAGFDHVLKPHLLVTSLLCWILCCRWKWREYCSQYFWWQLSRNAIRKEVGKHSTTSQEVSVYGRCWYELSRCSEAYSC